MTIKPIYEELEQRVKELEEQVSEQKRDQRAQQLSRHFLEISNRHRKKEALLEELVSEIQKVSGCEAVGIRMLDEENNIPYEAFTGFSKRFYESESLLSIDSDECMCINVIKGDTNPALPFYTEHGSFYMNGTTRFLATVSEEEKGKTRNVCNEMGYESVALIPIRRMDRMLGLIHLADRQENRVPLETVELLEDTTQELGVGIGRIQAEELLERSKKQWETTFDAISDWVSLIDVEHQIMNSNRAGGEILGLPLDAIIGNRICKLLHGSDSPLPGCPTTKMLKTKKREGVELQMPNGRWVMVSVDPVIGDDRKVAAAVHIVRDITDRKQREQALLESNDNLDKAQKIGHMGSWNRDLKTDEAHFSDEMYRIMGLTPGEPPEISYEFVLSLTHPEDREHLNSVIQEAIENKSSYEIEFRTVPINGSERIIHSRGEVECDERGVAVRRFGINQDITEPRCLQAQLLEAEKTKTIATLAGGVAHQFNNALSSITGHTGLLEMEYPEDEKIMDYAKAMKQSAHRMAHLTSQLLAYARGGKYNSQARSPTNFVEGALPIIQHILDPDIRVETDLPQDVMNVEMDRTQMQMVLSAIVTNSNEAIDPPGRVRISTRNMDLDKEFAKDHPGLKPGLYVCLSIEDDGKGMDEETRSRIFDPFFTTHFIGRGLGMASAYGIVKNHGGAITVDSELGKGTVVKIYLPAIEAKEEVKKKVFLSPTAELATGEGTILVIEDEEPLVKLFSQILERLGYRVLQAMTGKEAVEVAKTFDGQIDLALLDIKLPDMDGGRVYPLIMEARPDLKVIVCSGYSIDGPAQAILDAGAEGFIQKPFSMAPFAEKLKEVLEGE